MSKELNAEKSRRLSRKWKSEGRCSHCGGERDNDRYIQCIKCRNRTKRLRGDLYIRRKEAGLCQRCGKNPVDGFLKCEACEKREYKYQSDKPEKQRERYRNLKDMVFQSYGGYVCNCCGETEPLFMCIDHINNDGADHRHKEKIYGRNIYTWLRKNNYPEGFQVLCQNCNFGKFMNKGSCPHKTKILSAGTG